jgi:hypothetical protein
MLRQLLVLEHFQVGVYRFLARPAQREQRAALARLALLGLKAALEPQGLAQLARLAFKALKVQLEARGLLALALKVQLV